LRISGCSIEASYCAHNSHGTVQIAVESRQTARPHVGSENLIADPVQRVQPSIPFLGVLLMLVLECLLQRTGLAQYEVPGLRQAFLEVVALRRSRIGTQHAVREAFEPVGQVSRGRNRKPGRAFQFQEVDHTRAAVEAHAHTFVVDVSGVTGRAGQSDHVGFGLAGRRIPGAAHPRETDRQAVEILDRGWLQLQTRDRCRRRLGLCVGSVVAVALQGRLVGMDGLRARQETESFQISPVLEQAGLGDQVNSRLFQRDKPVVGHGEGHGALTCMMEPVPVLDRPVLVEPMRLFDRWRFRQPRRQ
jgi:hypothetical protein